jgi:hypothetical protein
MWHPGHTKASTEAATGAAISGGQLTDLIYEAVVAQAPRGY